MVQNPEFDWVRREDGTSEFEDFVASLPAKDAAKLLAVIRNTEVQGLSVAVRMQWVKKLDGDLYELRSNRANNIQRAIYFQVVGSKFVITHGFTKKTQKTPVHEIEHAQHVRSRYLREENGER
jgi:phage-related protein